MNVTMTGGKRKVSSSHFLLITTGGQCLIFCALYWGLVLSMELVGYARMDIDGGSEAEEYIGDQTMRGCRIMRANVLAADEPKPNYLVLPASGGWRGWAYKSENSVGGDVDCYRGEQEVKYWGYCMHVHSINLAKILAISMFPFLHAPSSPSALSTRPCLLELCAQRCCSIFFILVSTSKPYLIPPSHCLLHPSPHYPCHHHFFSSYPYSLWPPS